MPYHKNALDAAIQEEPQNTAKVPKSGLDDGGLLTEGSQSSNNTSNDNPKTPKVPNDLGGLNDNGG
ncbi:MAG TPA: hypothetical protein VF220_10715 [Nitrososphaeraceae archaeon]